MSPRHELGTMTVPPPTPSPGGDDELSDDAFLGGTLRILQPRSGYRAGVDAVLLAAAVPLEAGEAAEVLDCGAGVGTVGLCVAARCGGARVTLVEREDELIRLASANVARNGLEARIRVVAGDLTAAAGNSDAPRLAPESFDHVLANPPFHDAGDGTRARDPLKAVSHAMARDGLDLWVRFAARMARPGGRVTVIHKAAALPALLAALDGRFGGLTVRSIHPRAAAPAIRVLVGGIKGSRAEPVLLPALVLHDTDGAFAPDVDRILRQGAGLDTVLQFPPAPNGPDPGSQQED